MSARTTRGLRTRAILSASALLAGLGAAALSTAPAATAATAAPLAPGAVASEDMTLLTNLPKRGAFERTAAYNSDIAFQGDYAFAGNYDGFTIYDISNPRKTREVSQVVCPGSQNDITVLGDLVFLSVDSTRNNASCNSVGATRAQTLAGQYWEGVRVFSVKDKAKPEYVAAVPTACGSHTHTLAGVQDGNAYLYVSSYNPSDNLAFCPRPHDKISVVEVPLGNPSAAKVVTTPVLFPDGGNDGSGYSRATHGCHDITAYPEKGIAAGACMGDGILMDITDVKNPVVTERVQDQENFSFWHSATFSNDASKVVFTDELGGGSGAQCDSRTASTKGANGIYDVVGGELRLASYYKIPREQAVNENCVAHNGNLVPVKTGKDIMVQAWYQGGISVYDFTDSANPTELAWFDRGAVHPTDRVLGGSWSAYYHDGYVYSNDIQMGLDVLEIKDPAVASAKSIRNKTGDVNVQSQQSYKG